MLVIETECWFRNPDFLAKTKVHEQMANTFERLLETSQLCPQQIAEQSGLTIEKVEAIATGRWLPSPTERKLLAEALGVPVETVDWGHTMSPRNVRYHRFGLPDG